MCILIKIFMYMWMQPQLQLRSMVMFFHTKLLIFTLTTCKSVQNNYYLFYRMITQQKNPHVLCRFSCWHSVNIKVSAADTHPFVPGIVTVGDVSHRPGRVQSSGMFYQRPAKIQIQSSCSCFMCQLQRHTLSRRSEQLLHSIKTKSKRGLAVFLL